LRSTLFDERGDDAILAAMPVIAIFFGIVIRMFYKEHEPRQASR